jgi:hypothetical protein
MRRVLTIIAFLALAAPAAAEGGRIVASSGDYDLYARHGKGSKICISVLGPDEYQSEGECATPTSPFHPVRVFSYRRSAPLGMAVPESVARVTAGDASADAIAVDGFPRARFVLLAGAAPSALVRFQDASGALIGAARPEFAFRASRGETVFRARDARIGLRRDFELEPTPLQLDRTVAETCLYVVVSRAGTDDCTLDRDLGSFDVDVIDGCAPAQGVLYGIVGPRVHRVEAVLGSGRRLRVRTAALAAGPARLLAVSLPRGEAVRSVRALGAPGRERIGAPPAGFPCADDDQTSTLYSYAEDGFGRSGKALTAPVTVAQAGGRSLRVADGRRHTELCSGLGRLSCAVPPVDSYYASLDRSGRIASGVLARDVARVDLTLSSGLILQAPTTDGAAYTGRFAGKVRFLAVELPAGVAVKRAVARGQDGRALGPLFADDFHEHRTRRPVEPDLKLVRGRFEFDGGVRTFACLQPRHPQAPSVEQGICDYSPLITTRAVVRCSTRRAIVYGRLWSGASVRLLLADGSTLRPRVRRFPGIGRVWTAVLPRTVGLRALRYRNGPGRRPFRIPPAARQCGYEDQFEFYDDRTRNATVRAGDPRPPLNARTVAR